jgi:hypothetical protein
MSERAGAVNAPQYLILADEKRNWRERAAPKAGAPFD